VQPSCHSWRWFLLFPQTFTDLCRHLQAASAISHRHWMSRSFSTLIFRCGMSLFLDELRQLNSLLYIQLSMLNKTIHIVWKIWSSFPITYPCMILTILASYLSFLFPDNRSGGPRAPVLALFIFMFICLYAWGQGLGMQTKRDPTFLDGRLLNCT
jgi:hypothetical protein